MKRSKGITLLALVITIVIMLLLAGVALQMAMGENGLIVKSTQAKREQAKAELLEIVKLNYLNLKTKAIENSQPSPEYELSLSTSEFLDKYNIVNDNIVDKQGNIIETKQEILNILKMLYPHTEGKKIVGGVEIPESDKDKMILKLKVLENTTMIFMAVYNSGYVEKSERVTIDYGNGEKEEITDYYSGYFKTYNVGEYIIKAENVTDFSIINGETEKYELEILHWGKIKEKEETNIINLQNVSKIYEPEPDKIPIRYTEPKFYDIPEWLFSKKITSKKMSEIKSGKNITRIPEELFKNCINIEEFYSAFQGCSNIEEIPENLFKHNIKAKNFSTTFGSMYKIKEIPENLFKHNINAEDFTGTFSYCTGIKEIPENLFRYNNKAERFEKTFEECISLESIPENLFKYNENIRNFWQTFLNCQKVGVIPNKIIEKVKKVKENGGSLYETFRGCERASNFSQLPEYMIR